MNTVLVGAGSNLGDRLHHLRRGVTDLARLGWELLAASPVYETEPVGCADPLPFLNCAASFSVGVGPLEALDDVQAVERAAGRLRTYANAPRTLDLDIIFFGADVVRHPRLEVPHPRLCERRFVLVPLSDIAPDFAHPATGRPVSRLLAECAAPGEVEWYCKWPGLLI